MKHREIQPELEQRASTPLVTLADVLIHLAADRTSSATRRRDLMSEVRSMGRILDTSLDLIPASPRLIRERLKGLEPAEVGLSSKRFTNIKSGILSALRLVGAVDVPVSRSQPMSPAWDGLWRSIENEQRRWKLSRFFRHCSARGIVPEAVDDTDDSVRRLRRARRRGDTQKTFKFSNRRAWKLTANKTQYSYLTKIPTV